MAANEPVPSVEPGPASTAPVPVTNQVSTADLAVKPAPVAAAPSAPTGESLYPPQGPAPAGTKAGAVETMAKETPGDPDKGAGIEGEEVVWEARYAMRNFVGRLIGMGLLSIGWIVLAVETWGYGHKPLLIPTILAAILVVVMWFMLLLRMTQARFGHYYKLTTRRLFVSSGLMRRRRDQMELLTLKDVFTRQTLFERWVSLGTVVVVSSSKELPTFYLTGVNDPKHVMDLVWHYARAERDHRSVKVEQV